MTKETLHKRTTDLNFSKPENSHTTPPDSPSGDGMTGNNTPDFADTLFTTMPVPKAYLKIALPVVAAMIVGMIYNLLDTFFVAKTGNVDLIAGVSIAAPMFTLMVALGDIFGQGGSSVVSRLFGKKDVDTAKHVSAFCFYGALFTGIAVMIVLLVLRDPVLAILGADADTMTYAREYYTIITIGTPIFLISYTPNNFLRMEGFSAASMAGALLGNVINILLDPFFILKLDLGAAGAAIATVLGFLGSDIFFILFVAKRSRKLSLKITDFAVKPVPVRQIFAIGVPASITSLATSFATLLTNRFLLAYGSDQVAAMGIVLKINTIALYVLMGFAVGGQALIGYSVGAKDTVRLRKILRFAFTAQCCMALAFAGILSAAAKPLMQLFVSDTVLIETGVRMLRLLQIGILFTGIVLVCTSLFQAAGKAWQAGLLSISRQGILFTLMITILSDTIGYTGILIAQPLSDILTAVMALILLYQTADSLFTKEAAKKVKRQKISFFTNPVPTIWVYNENNY